MSASPSGENRSLERIAALLAKAEATDNDAERDAFMATAQRLATLHSIELATARAHARNKNKNASPVQRMVTIGPRRKHGLKNFVELMYQVATANDVLITIAHNSTFVNLFGFQEDIELAERLYGSLLHQMVAACERYLATGQYKNETALRRVRMYDYDLDMFYTDWGLGPTPKQTARTNFQQEYADRIGTRLWRAKKDTEKEVEKEEVSTDQAPGVALVLAEKTKEVQAFYDATSNARGSWRGARTSAYSESASAAGRAAADRAQLSSPDAIRGTRGAIE
jgi:hypothetical protein